MLTIEEYRRWTRNTAQYESKHALSYLVYGLVGEAGEVANEFKRGFEKGKEVSYEALISEMGDVLWYLIRLADTMNISLEQLAALNQTKLEQRFNDFLPRS